MPGPNLPSLAVPTRLRRTAATLAMVALTSGCGLIDRTPDPGPALHRFAEGLRNGTVDPAMLADPDDAAPAERLLSDITEELAASPQFPLAGPVEIGPEPGATPDGGGPSAAGRLRVRWRLASGTWAYDSRVHLRLIDGRWKVAWRPSVLHPQLRDGHMLAAQWITSERGPILSGDGAPLFKPHPVVTVYVQPRRVRDLDEVLAVLADTLDVASAPLRERVEAADPDHLVEVITLRVEDYAPLRATLHPVPGLVFDQSRRPLTPTRAFARTLLGRIGPPTAEVLDEVGPGFDADDMLGLSGLQRRFQHRLAGRPGVRITTVDDRGDVLMTVHEAAPTPGEALRTTLDPRLQLAADAALTTVDGRSALVALRASDGEVLAVANGPDGGSVDLALTGRYAPGPTFNVITTAALLTAGTDLDEPVPCPASLTVGGRTFRNAAAGGVRGRVPLRSAFASACDTALAGLAARVSPDEITSRARQFGFEGQWHPGVDAFTGALPDPIDDAERAAVATGREPVVASPLLMASVAAAVADGTWRPPVLLPDHARPGPGPQPLDPLVAAELAGAMRAVVLDGTGARLRGVSGRAVHAVTGAVERRAGDGVHAWTIAYRRDLAIATLVEDGHPDGRDAAAVAERFFRELSAAAAAVPR